MSTITAPVGLRHRTQKVASRRVDQRTVIDLLRRIPTLSGGRRELWLPGAPEAGQDGDCPPALAEAIYAFQQFWVLQGVFKTADGVVDPKGRMLAKLDELAANPPAPPEPDPDAIAIGDIVLRQRNPPDLVALHTVSNPVVQPLSLMLPKLVQFELQARIRELRFEVTKPGGKFWVGVAVPEATSDFTRTHVFFHPTPVQNGKVRAADTDYPNFVNGWPNRIMKYMPRNGGQMAAARRLPLVVPYSTMASVKMDPKTNVFADRPAETLRAILAATERVVTTNKSAMPDVKAVSCSSFSSGISFLVKFIEVLKFTDLIVEVMDFDSTFIRVAHPHVSGLKNATFVQFTQFEGMPQKPNRYDLPPPRWVETNAKDSDGKPLSVHGKIGFMMFYTGMLFSALPPT